MCTAQLFRVRREVQRESETERGAVGTFEANASKLVCCYSLDYLFSLRLCNRNDMNKRKTAVDISNCNAG